MSIFSIVFPLASNTKFFDRSIFKLISVGESHPPDDDSNVNAGEKKTPRSEFESESSA